MALLQAGGSEGAGSSMTGYLKEPWEEEGGVSWGGPAAVTHTMGKRAFAILQLGHVHVLSVQK